MSPNQESLLRAKELEETTKEYLSFKRDIQTQEQRNTIHYHSQKRRLLAFFDANETDWNDWHWQMKHRITSVDILAQFIQLSTQEQEHIRQVTKTNRFAIVPYYLALISNSPNDPIKRLSVPQQYEIVDLSGLDDPMAEEFTNPAGSITRRYPDRLIINVTNICAMYCRHCQRRRLIG